MGSQVSVIIQNKKWSKIFLNGAFSYKEGYILTKNIVNMQTKNPNWVGVSEKLINTPYFWGGRSSKGVECSALVQLSLQTFGIKFPRDSYMQEKMNYFSFHSTSLIRRGDIIFWNGHVGIMQDNINIIHSNSFHEKVYSEPLQNLIKRQMMKIKKKKKSNKNIRIQNLVKLK